MTPGTYALLVEVALPPKNNKAYILILDRKLRDILKLAEWAASIENDPQWQEFFHDYNLLYTESLIYPLRRIQEAQYGFLWSVQKLADYIRRDKTELAKVGWDYLPDSAKRELENMERWQETVVDAKTELKRLQQQVTDDADWYDQNEPDVPQKLLRITQVPNYVDLYIKALKDAVIKLDALAHWREKEMDAMHRGGKGMPDDIGEVEKAYHATFRAKSLYEHGFEMDRDWRAENPDQGLGGGQEGSGKQGRISFTLDFHLAQNIVRVFKVLHLIANGEMSSNAVIRHIQGVLDRKVKEDEGGLYDLPKIVQIYQRKKRSPFPPQSIPDTLDFYATALWLIDEGFLRSNPVFWGFDGEKMAERLQGYPADEIGIIEAEIRTEDALWLPHERELRVLPEDVTQMTRLIV